MKYLSAKFLSSLQFLESSNVKDGKGDENMTGFKFLSSLQFLESSNFKS